jgi:hypothetical protein
MNTQKQQLLESLNTRNKIYLGQVKKLSRRYRDKIRLDKDALIAKYLADPRLELGVYRHNNTYVNYDYLVEKINDKYQEVNFALSQEIIHSCANRVNDLILECIVQAERQRDR